ncbi:MAG: serine/threonine-protein kinase [Candidatus Sumerlaeaceae bacterium]|nr:serine/threonine-protein kinase [Candidatus Sumerlaeaceae bacterium]
MASNGGKRAGARTGSDQTSTLTPAVAMAPAPPLERGAVLKARHSYRLERVLGRGGYASVYLAETLETSSETPEVVPRQVALKVFNSPVEADPAQFLKRELSSLLALRHERIIRVYDWNLDPPNAFVVLEYHPSGNLFQAGASGRLPAEGEVWRLLAHLMSALSTAHRASILHLDIKPDNVLVDVDGNFVLTDFGISQGSGVSRQQMAFGLGSPGYQAPEQRFRDTNLIGARTDLWGAGATAYAYFTGLRLNRHLNLLAGPGASSPFGLPPVSEHRPCSAALEQVIMSLLMFEPLRRPGSAAEVLAQVMRHTSAGDIQPAVLGSGRKADPAGAEVRELVSRIVDPHLAAICKASDVIGKYIVFEDGEVLASQGDLARHAFVLLQGEVVVERAGDVESVVCREGVFLGEVSALTGLPRTTTLRARGRVWVLAFNAAEFEQFVVSYPAVAVRLLKSLAVRLADRPNA